MIPINLNIKSIKALADLGVPGMDEHVSAYNTCTHRWRNNIDILQSYIGYFVDEPSADFSKNSELLKGFADSVTLIDALLTEQQRQYIWSGLDETHYLSLIQLRSKIAFLLNDSDKITAKLYLDDSNPIKANQPTYTQQKYSELITECDTELDTIVVAFNEVF